MHDQELHLPVQLSSLQSRSPGHCSRQTERFAELNNTSRTQKAGLSVMQLHTLTGVICWMMMCHLLQCSTPNGLQLPSDSLHAVIQTATPVAMSPPDKCIPIHMRDRYHGVGRLQCRDSVDMQYMTRHLKSLQISNTVNL